MGYKTKKILKDSYYKRNRKTLLIDALDRRSTKRSFIRLFFKNIDDMEKKYNKFWSKFKKIDDCLIWTGENMRGYGASKCTGKFQVTHRTVYEIKVGKIPTGYVLHHTCRNTLCANVDHLELTTQKKNLSYVLPLSKCRKGHEFTSENTYVTPNGVRICRICRRNTLKNHKLKSMSIFNS